MTFTRVAGVSRGRPLPAAAVGLLSVVVLTRIFSVAGSDRVAPGLLALLFGIVIRLTGHHPRQRDAVPAYIGFVGFYVCLAALSSLWSDNPSLVLSNTRVLAFYALVGLGAVMCVRDPRSLRWAFWGLIVAGLAVGLLAIRQYLTQDYSNDVFGLARASVEQIVGKQSAYRSGGPVGDANFFGQMMAVVVVAAIAGARSARSRWAAALGAVTALIGTFTVVITYSRGALIALAVGLVVSLFLFRHKAAAIATTIVVLMLAVLILPGGYTQRVSQLESANPLTSSAQTDPAIDGRTSSWIVATAMFAHNPAAGVGYGDFNEHYLRYSSHVGRDTRGEKRNAHSYPLQLAAEQGLIGVAAMLAVLAVAFGLLSRTRRVLAAQQPADQRTHIIVTGLRNALVVYLVASVFLHAAYPQLFWYLIGLCFACGQMRSVSLSGQAVNTSDRPISVGLTT